MTIALGDKIPHLTLPASGGKTVALAKDYVGKKIVLYFYPKDNTSGCTLEGQDFAQHFSAFEDANCVILGISRDSVKAHDNFCAKFGFPFLLLSDTEEHACNAFDAIVEKSLYGRKYMGIDRCTYLFNEKGVLVKFWRKVKVKGHVEEVLSQVKAL